MYRQVASTGDMSLNTSEKRTRSLAPYSNDEHPQHFLVVLVCKIMCISLAVILFSKILGHAPGPHRARTSLYSGLSCGEFSLAQ